MWICNGSNGTIDRIAQDGAATQYPLPSGDVCGSVTPNPDGNVYFGWFNTQNSLAYGIGQITPLGIMRLFNVTGSDGQSVDTMTSASDGNVWSATNGTDIWRTTPQGGTTVFPSTVSWGVIVRGADKNLWGTFSTPRGFTGIARISVADGSVAQMYSGAAFGIVGASDGGIWFGQGNAMARLDPATGDVISYPIDRTVYPYYMMQGRAGLLYFLDTRWFPPHLGRYNIRTHKLFKDLNLQGSHFEHAALGPDSNIWISDFRSPQFNVYVADLITPTPSSITVGVGQSTPLSVTEKGYTKSLSATTSDPAIATVTQTGSNQFSVTGVAVGSCSITLSDNKGNSEEVPVTVN